jgi:hypothetical protein
MTWQTQFGKRAPSFGCWIAKPGYDVTTASSGNMLFDTSKLGMQPLQSGPVLLYGHGEGGTGNIIKTVSLSVGGASRLAVGFEMSYQFLAAIPSPFTTEQVYDGMTQLDDLQAVVSGGSLYLNYVNPPRSWSDTYTIDIWAFYSVLRARY